VLFVLLLLLRAALDTDLALFLLALADVLLDLLFRDLDDEALDFVDPLLPLLLPLLPPRRAMI